jgi:ATP-binding cassette subfamily B protein
MKSHPYLWRLLRPKKSLPPIAILLFLEIGLTVLAPLPIQTILNELIRGGPAATNGWRGYSASEALVILSLLSLVAGSLLVWVAISAQSYLGRLSARLNEDLRRDFFAKLFTRRQSFLDSTKKVDILGHLSGDISNLETLIISGIPALVRDLPMIFVVLTMMFVVNVKLSLLFSLCLPLLYLLGRHFTLRMRSSSKSLRRETARFEEETHEALASMAVVKSLRAEEKIYQQILGRVTSLTRLTLKNISAGNGLDASMALAQYGVRAGFILLGCWSILSGEIGIGDLFLLFAYMEILARHINGINKFLTKYPKCSASMDRLENFRNALEKYPEFSGEKILRSAKQLSFQRVSFSYVDGTPILNDFSLSLGGGKLVAVMGASGSGKSSFGRLLNRLVDPVEGRIEIGGEDIRTYDLKSLRSRVRLVTQENFLLAGTVRENLLLATSGPTTDSALIEALAAVNALGFVSALPHGLDTVIGEGGQQLSGGQAKRIHLARAFIDQKSEIVLFDEPTSGLDPLSAGQVIDSIRGLAREKTLVLWVTHRMQEALSADRVLFFRPGKNPVYSTHRELLTEPDYREMADKGPAAESVHEPSPENEKGEEEEAPLFFPL